MAGILPYLRLLRAGTLFSPAGDVVAGMCLVATASGNPVWTAAGGRAIAASVLLYGAGMVWNDIADRHEDARQRPERPIPSGQVPLAAAIAFGLLLLAGGLLLSPCTWHHGLIASLVLAYDFVLKRRAMLGALAMGSLRALNLVTAAAGAIAVPTALLAAAACYGGYIVAVTILGIYEDEKSVRPRAVVAVQTAPMLLAFAGLLAAQGSLWPAPLLAAIPCLWLARRNRLTTRWDQSAIRRSMMFLLLGTMLYTGLLCLAVGRPIEAVAVVACIPLARRVTAAIRLRTLT